MKDSVDHTLQDLHLQRRQLIKLALLLHQPPVCFYLQLIVLPITPLLWYLPVSSSVTLNTPSRYPTYVLSTRYKYIYSTIATAYLVPSFSTSTYMCFADYIASTELTEVHSPHPSSKPHPDPRKFPSLIPKLPSILALKQTYTEPNFCLSNLLISAPASQHSRLNIPLLLNQQSQILPNINTLTALTKITHLPKPAKFYTPRILQTYNSINRSLVSPT